MWNGYFSSLKGKVLSSVEVSNDEVHFYTIDGEHYKCSHYQDCCESVYIESVNGDIQDLIGNPILIAEESTNIGIAPEEIEYESATWTFYKLAIIKGYVDIRWVGTSNGYYSEDVDFEKVLEDVYEK